MSEIERSALLVFVRAPEPGRTKTRLARTIGAEHAAQVYRRMAEASVKTALEVAGAQVRVIVWASPAERAAEITRWLEAACGMGAPRFELRPQPEGDLGVRLLAAFEDAFAAGARKVVVIGSDCVELDAALCRTAFAALDRHDAVLGPARDGGYYLLGLRRPMPRVFEGIAWGTQRVGAQTLSRLRSERAEVALLRVLDDIDTGADLERAAAMRPWLTEGLGVSFEQDTGPSVSAAWNARPAEADIESGTRHTGEEG